MGTIIVSYIDTDPSYSHEGYRIFTSNGRYGIKKQSGPIIISPIFSDIRWHKDTPDVLIEFELNGLYALCRFKDLQQESFLLD